ncbi:GMP synthase [glutamine-hydrolyzing] [compost metagenome]
MDRVKGPNDADLGRGRMIELNLLCIQHVPFENPGAIVEWAMKRGHECTVIRLYEGEALPPMTSWDMLLILGGPMSIHDENEYPWLIEEKIYLKEAIRNHKYVVGICLGAQLIAAAMGARVYLNEEKEIGWFPIEWTEEALSTPFFQSFPTKHDVFHWHGETFDLPEGATLLASSEACRNQAFTAGYTVFGFQFHFEMLEDNIRSILSNCGDEVTGAAFIQRADEMLLDSSQRIDKCVMLLEQFLRQIEQCVSSR